MSHLGSSVNESQNAWYCRVHHPISHGFWLDPIPISWLQCDMNYGLQPDIMMVKSYYRCWIIKSLFMMVIQKKLGIKTRIKIIFGQNHVIQISEISSHFMFESPVFPWLNPLIGTRPGLKHFTAACQLFTTRLARLRNARSSGCETGTCARVRQGDNRAAWGIQGILVADFHGKIPPICHIPPQVAGWFRGIRVSPLLGNPNKWAVFHHISPVDLDFFVGKWDEVCKPLDFDEAFFFDLPGSRIWNFHHPQLRSWSSSPWMPSSPAHHTLESITTWQPSRELPKTWVWGGRWIYLGKL